MFNNKADGLMREAKQLSRDALNLDAYRATLAEDGIEGEAAEKLLAELISIMRMCVEMGFSLDLCGQLLDGFNELAAPYPAEVSSWNQEVTEHLANGKEEHDGD